MTDPLDLLRAANPFRTPDSLDPELGERVLERVVAANDATPVGGRRRRAIGRRPRGRLFALAGALVIAAGGTAAALGVLNGTPSQAPSGTTRSGVPNTVGAASDTYTIGLVPALNGGNVGWCVWDSQRVTNPLTPMSARRQLLLFKLTIAHVEDLLTGRAIPPDGRALTAAQRALYRRRLAGLRRLEPALRQWAAGRNTPSLRAQLAVFGGGVGGGVTSSAGCGYVQRTGSPIIAFEGDQTGSPAGSYATFAVVTTSHVAAVRVAPTLTILTRPDKALPNGYRIAVRILRYNGPASAPTGPAAHRYATPIALAADGQVIRNRPTTPFPLHNAAVYWQRRAGSRPPGAPPGLRSPPPGACEIDTTRLSGSKLWYGEVVTHVHGFPQLAGRTFLDCANTQFADAGEGVVAAILLDAQHPGRPPAPLPNTTDVPGRPGTVNELTPERAVSLPTPTRVSPIYITARRVGHAWLVVQAGGTIAQRIAILDRLGSCIRLNGSLCPSP